MQLTLINAAAYITAFFFLILLYRSNVWRWSNIKRNWKQVKENQNIKTEIIEAEKKGEKPFYFQNGKVVVYATSKYAAKAKFDKIRKESNLKKPQNKA